MRMFQLDALLTTSTPMLTRHRISTGHTVFRECQTNSFITITGISRTSRYVMTRALTVTVKAIIFITKSALIGSINAINSIITKSRYFQTNCLIIFSNTSSIWSKTMQSGFNFQINGTFNFIRIVLTVCVWITFSIKWNTMSRTFTSKLIWITRFCWVTVFFVTAIKTILLSIAINIWNSPLIRVQNEWSIQRTYQSQEWGTQPPLLQLNSSLWQAIEAMLVLLYVLETRLRRF